MKNLLISVLLTALIAGCDSNFLDINNSPNDPATATPKLVLPSGIASSAYVIGGWYQLLGGIWAQHWAQSTGAGQWTDWEDYALRGDYYDDYQFGVLYSGSLNDMEYLRNETKRTKDWTYHLIATCIQSYTFQVLADLYDKIPFTEALKGTGNFSPKWDDGQLVYDSLIARLDYAINKDFTLRSGTNPDATSSEIGIEDIIFQGDINAWIRFANTLKLKLYLRQVYARPTVAQAGIQNLLTGNNLLIQDASMNTFANQQDRRNPVYETCIDRLSGNIAASATLLNYLKNNSDPRLSRIFSPASSNGLMTGIMNGHYRLDAAIYPNIQSLSTPNLGPVDPVFFFSKAECYFLLSEACLRYGDINDSKTYYNLGIQSSMEKFGATYDPSVFGPGGIYEFPATGLENRLKAIMVQKWIASANSESLEAFFDQNRTGYPDFLTLSPTNVTGGKFPKRLIFPETERKSNVNTPEQVPIYTKVWWDTKVK